MARPREFDEATVLDAALETFWTKGFDGTSIEDLVQATGLGRASLYGAFGDKEQLFSRVLEHYLARVEALEARPLEGRSPEVLARMTAGWVAGVCPKDAPRGCFLTLSGTSGASAQFVRDALLRAVSTRQRALKRLIARGQACGELEAGRDPDTLARFLIVMQQGVSTAARAGMSRRELDAAMREAVDHVIGTSAPRARRA